MKPLQPYDREVERAVLGAVLLDNGVVPDVLDACAPEDFGDGRHEAVMRAVAALHDAGRPVDYVTLGGELGPRGLAGVGGLPWLVALVESTPSSAHVLFYARQVREYGVVRRIALACRESAAAASRHVGPVAELIDSVEGAILAATGESYVSPPSPIAPVARDVVETLDAPGRRRPGLTTGWPDLDDWTGGWHPGELIVLGGRPSCGKSAAATHFLAAAASAGTGVYFCTLEVSKRQVLLNLVAQKAQIDTHRLRQNEMHDDERACARDAAHAIEGWPVVIDDSCRRFTEVRRRAVRAVSAGARLVVVDYIGLLVPPPSRSKSRNREREIAEMSEGFKALAVECDIPVIVLSQLNRGSTHRTNPRPRLSDLRDSGSLEADANVVLFVHRPNKNEAPSSSAAEILVAKQRAGAIGVMPMNFNAPTITWSPATGREPARSRPKPEPDEPTWGTYAPPDDDIPF